MSQYQLLKRLCSVSTALHMHTFNHRSLLWFKMLFCVAVSTAKVASNEIRSDGSDESGSIGGAWVVAS